ncbi:MAG: ribosome-associated translation inhibitor RaiA [Verrucomicrobiae bacterium]|nr:ribosome-associated translation inhibitor RaiA [Verrucomicrobiae bacterium]
MQKDHAFVINVTGRHVSVTPALKEYARKKIEHLSPDYPRIISAHVVLSVEKHRQRAEITLYCNNHIVIEAHNTSDDLYASIDIAIDKVLQQMRKHKTKLKKHHRPRKFLPTEIEVPVYAADHLEDEASEEIKARQVHAEKMVIRPMFLDEAILELSINQERSFLVFFNTETEIINIMYRRADGDYSVIVPTKA